MSDQAPRPGIDPDDLLRELNALIEYADSSCSESEDFMRGMRFLFDALVEKVAPLDHPSAPSGTGSAPMAGVIAAKPQRLTP